MSLLERTLAITHDLGLPSIAFPLIGAGANNYPVLEVIKAIIDACSLFRQKQSPLKKVVIVVWEHDKKNEQVSLSEYTRCEKVQLLRPFSLSGGVSKLKVT